MPINITNPKNRDAVVATEGLLPKREFRYVDEKGDPVHTQKVLKSDVTHDLPELLKKRKKLDKRDSLLLLRGGEKGNEPIVLNRGGKQYNAFLEGRVKGDAYCLIMHLSNVELKKPKELDGGV